MARLGGCPLIGPPMPPIMPPIILCSQNCREQNKETRSARYVSVQQRRHKLALVLIPGVLVDGVDDSETMVWMTGVDDSDGGGGGDDVGIDNEVEENYDAERIERLSSRCRR
eukprot:763479-Pleurochrysis_carterae.AAC.1